MGTILAITKKRINYYSNPNITVNGSAIGEENEANNARLLTEQRFKLAEIGDERTCNGIFVGMYNILVYYLFVHAQSPFVVQRGKIHLN